MSLELILLNASQTTVLSDASGPSLRWCLAPENTEPNKGFTSIKMTRPLQPRQFSREFC
jgi:hypothetical protein